jgi:hypothetical protein
MLQVNRTAPFSLTHLLGEGWKIKSQDPRATYGQVDFSKVLLQTTLTRQEVSTSGEELLSRQRNRHAIGLDIYAFLSLKRNPPQTHSYFFEHHLPESFKKVVHGMRISIFFGATILENPTGRQAILYLRYSTSEDGVVAWRWGYRLLVQQFYRDHLLAMI